MGWKCRELAGAGRDRCRGIVSHPADRSGLPRIVPAGTPTTRLLLETPWYGTRQMVRHLRRDGHGVGRERVRRLMRLMGLAAIYQRPRTTVPHPEHRVLAYLLRGLLIDRPNQVWCADITYIPMRRGFLYLVAVMDWATRKVLAWRLSNTMDVAFCVAAVEEARGRVGKANSRQERCSFIVQPRLAG